MRISPLFIFAFHYIHFIQIPRINSSSVTPVWVLPKYRFDQGFNVIFRGIVITALPKQEKINYHANCLFYMRNKAGAVVYVIGL